MAARGLLFLDVAARLVRAGVIFTAPGRAVIPGFLQPFTSSGLRREPIQQWHSIAIKFIAASAGNVWTTAIFYQYSFD